MRSVRGERGQATVEYLALIAIFALLIAAATAVAGGAGAPSIANAVLGQVRRALCVVTGDACPAQRQVPCVTASERDDLHVAVKAVIFRVDRDHVLLRERLSDGSVRLTFAWRSGAGVETGLGGRAQVSFGGRRFGPGSEARVGAEGVFAVGRVYRAADDREADEILRGLLRPRLPFIGGGPPAREIFVEGGVRALGRLGIGAATARASLEGLAESVIGARRDQRSGEITISLGTGSSGWALLNGLAVGPSGSSDRSVGLDLTLDRHRRPIALGLHASGTLAAGVMPSRSAGGSQLQGQLWAAGMLARRWEIDARIDLRDPDVVAAWAAYRRAPLDAVAIAALAAQLRNRANIDVRGYAVRSASGGVDGELALVLKLGGELDLTRDSARLLAASSRPPGGLWEQRIDCTQT